MTFQFPLVTAHAGSMDMAAHTLHSVQAMLALGVDVVEEDIRVTRDGIPVLAHDDEMVTVDGVGVSLSDMTYDQLSGLQFQADHGDRGETVRICMLEALLPIIGASGKTINLDLKVDESIEPAAALVRKYGLSEQAFFSGCERDRAMLAQQLHPEMRKLLNTDVNLFKTMTYTDAMVQTVADAKEAGCFGINIYHGILTQTFMTYAASEGLPVYVWTVNEAEAMGQFAAWDVASITTRNVAELMKLKQTWV
ncbi:glycerophosphodiester phosphodiesterase [Paenibacillus sp. R14(2021)]|uniref:glycerophosphodiester phosphodiesterase n=1 Tax=Paenibacillus sp. R14(2021) TaxID=2859228 RepID=UPI001C612549|nr:glycerophosphodiester phosphodiesterase [Paenibacillus sp. R14(2021)]